jgi:hypothetical protein
MVAMEMKYKYFCDLLLKNGDIRIIEEKVPKKSPRFRPILRIWSTDKADILFCVQMFPGGRVAFQENTGLWWVNFKSNAVEHVLIHVYRHLGPLTKQADVIYALEKRKKVKKNGKRLDESELLARRELKEKLWELNKIWRLEKSAEKSSGSGSNGHPTE